MFEDIDDTTQNFLMKFHPKYQWMNDEDNDDIFSEPLPITVEEDVPSTIICASRDYVKRDSLMRVIRNLVFSPDEEDYLVDHYNRQQVVADEMPFDPVIDEHVEDLYFPEVGAERLTEKKINALTIVTDKGIVAARHNEHIMTHCVSCELGEEEVIVFGIKFYERDVRFYRWHRDKIVPIVSSGPCWLRFYKGQYYNMTIGVNCSDATPPDFCIPSFSVVDSYYVWVDGMVYLMPSAHVFSLYADGSYFSDKNGVKYAATNHEGTYLATIDGMVIAPSKRMPDSTQVIKSMMAAGVTTRDFLVKYPHLENRGVYVLSRDLKGYIREFPDTLVSGFQYIGLSSAMSLHKSRALLGKYPKDIVVGHNIFPSYNGSRRMVKVNGILYSKRRVRYSEKIVIGNNKFGVPSGTWYKR